MDDRACTLALVHALKYVQTLPMHSHTHTRTHACFWLEEEGHYATVCVEILLLVKTCYGYNDHINAKSDSNNDLSLVSKYVC